MWSWRLILDLDLEILYNQHNSGIVFQFYLTVKGGSNRPNIFLCLLACMKFLSWETWRFLKGACMYFPGALFPWIMVSTHMLHNRWTSSSFRTGTAVDPGMFSLSSSGRTSSPPHGECFLWNGYKAQVVGSCSSYNGVVVVETMW